MKVWHTLFGLGLALIVALPAFAATPCHVLAGQIDAQPGGPAFLPSYPTVRAAGPLKDTAFLYDNAVAALALIGCGTPQKAARIGDAILVALDHDRYWHDGRLRNAYLAGVVADHPVKLAGWWDDKQNQWVEDQYQVGSDSGNLGWAMLALLALHRATHDPAMLKGAERLAGYLASSSLSAVAPGGYTGGTFGDEPAPKRNLWKSTEHNADLAAALRELAAQTGKHRWRLRARRAAAFVAAMWSKDCACFAAGTGLDGHTRNPQLALDAQLWPLLALPELHAKANAAIATAEAHLATGGGFAYSDVRQGVWTEGTAQGALLMGLLGRKKQAAALLKAAAANRAPDGFYFATASGAMPTGFGLETDPTQPRLYFHLPHLAALAWVALAQTRFNPFTGTRALPR